MTLRMLEELEDSAASRTGSVVAELIAVIVAVTDGEPRVLTIDDGRALPSGPFETGHRSLQAALRSWVEQQTHHPLGYVEQLYTFADRDRAAAGRQVVSVSYLGLTREAAGPGEHGVGWRDWYGYFPWEDRREVDAVPAEVTAPLLAWAEAAADAMLRWQRRNRVAINFGLEGHAWNEDLVLQRYETLWEAGLVPEAGGRASPGRPMAHDHRRILATGIARLRGKIKYRPRGVRIDAAGFHPVGQLQRTVEALAGPPPAQAEFPPADRAAGPGGGNRRMADRKPADARPNCSVSVARWWPSVRWRGRNCRWRGSVPTLTGGANGWRPSGSTPPLFAVQVHKGRGCPFPLRAPLHPRRVGRKAVVNAQ